VVRCGDMFKCVFFTLQFSLNVQNGHGVNLLEHANGQTTVDMDL